MIYSPTSYDCETKKIVKSQIRKQVGFKFRTISILNRMSKDPFLRISL